MQVCDCCIGETQRQLPEIAEDSEGRSQNPISIFIVHDHSTLGEVLPAPFELPQAECPSDGNHEAGYLIGVTPQVVSPPPAGMVPPARVAVDGTPVITTLSMGRQSSPQSSEMSSTPTASPTTAQSGKFGRLNLSHKGHRNLAIRGVITACHAVLTLVLYFNLKVAHLLPTACCQLWASATLMIQCRTGNPWMFVLRSWPSFLRCVLVVYLARCGRAEIMLDGCNDDAWGDIRAPLRVFHCIAAVRFFFNGTSLMCQFLFPMRGVGKFGNEQLFYRGFVQGCGIPINLLRGMVKLGSLDNTVFQRGVIEVIIQFVRCFFLVPISSWSLFNQWATTGAGKQTDDNRTSWQGMVHPNAVTSIGHVLEAHKGHRNLLIRGVVSAYQAVVTAFLIAYDIDRAHKVPIMVCQLMASVTLVNQWRSGNPFMFVLRAFASFGRCIVLLHLAACGRRLPWEPCDSQGWSDERFPFRILHCFAALRMLLNGCSLFCQYLFSHRMFLGHGNEQLFFRGCIQGSGIFLHLTRAILKLVWLQNIERSRLEIAVNFIRALCLIPIATWSLFNQWFHSSTGNTGHKRLNGHEEFRRARSLSLESRTVC